MDYSSKFLGTYNDVNHQPWYVKTKGTAVNKRKNKHYIDLDDIIYGQKTDSKITKEVIEAEKREAFRFREEEQRDRTREKVFKRYEEYEDRYVRLETR
jgi:hypothetical protein